MNGSKKNLSDQLECVIFELEKEIAKISKNILFQFPIETYLADAKSCPVIYRHKRMWRKLRKLNRKIVMSFNKSASVFYNKLVLVSFMRESLDNLEQNNLPDNIIQLYKEWFARIIKDIFQLSDNYYVNSNAFRDDLGVCSLNVIPVGGAWLVDTSRVSMKLFFANGIRQFINFSVFTLFIHGGLKPYYVIHTYDRYLPLINSGEMDKAYLRIAELLKRNPAIKGIYRCSWFLDPMIGTISQQLSYLRQIPVKNGAKLFRKGTSQSDIKYATFNSIKRKKLFIEKKYIPTSYAYIWPRDEVLKWASKN